MWAFTRRLPTALASLPEPPRGYHRSGLHLRCRDLAVAAYSAGRRQYASVAQAWVDARLATSTARLIGPVASRKIGLPWPGRLMSMATVPNDASVRRARAVS